MPPASAINLTPFSIKALLPGIGVAVADGNSGANGTIEELVQHRRKPFAQIARVGPC
jgi:hypothetical protein